LQLTPIIEKPLLSSYILEFDYTLMNEVMTLLKRFNCEVVSKEMQLFCHMQIGIPKASEESTIEKLQELYTLQIKKV
jgi:hypothetical protein